MCLDMCINSCLRVCTCAHVCVCETFVPKRVVPYLFVIQHLQVQAFIPITAGGQCMPDSHCPTKTLSVHGDIWPDQPDVPATVCMEKRQEFGFASPII